MRLVTNNFSEETIEASMGLMFYRVIQEQVNNIVKHAEATHATIEFKVTELDIVLQISDNGKGFNTDGMSTGIGLKNIMNRVGFYDGVTHIISAPGNGCMLEVLIPLTSDEK